MIALHEEDPSLSAAGVMHEGEVSALLGVAGIPSISESAMIARDSALARYEEGRIHVQHVSARESVEVVEQAKAAGTRISCEATPHHLLLTDEDVRELDTNMKMNPPLRAAADREALIEALRSGAIDCVATDHAPHAREEKEQPFELAPMGVTGLETAFAALHTGLVVPGRVELPLLVERMTAGGAPFGLATPSLAPGSAANVCLVDLDAVWEVGEAGYESRSENCAFAGRRLTGRVRMTIADGAVAYRERSFALGAVT
jgi:dihydroorotase